jgi:hypothetical protein
VTDLAAATEAYQALLEGHRRDPDDELLWEDLEKARTAMEVAWLKAMPTRMVTAPAPTVARPAFAWRWRMFGVVLPAYVAVLAGLAAAGHTTLAIVALAGLCSGVWLERDRRRRS